MRSTKLLKNSRYKYIISKKSERNQPQIKIIGINIYKTKNGFKKKKQNKTK